MGGNGMTNGEGWAAVFKKWVEETGPHDVARQMLATTIDRTAKRRTAPA